MQTKRNKTRHTVMILVAVVALMAGLFFSQHLQKDKIDASQFNGTLLDHPRKISSFSLKGVDHQPFNNQSLAGKWTFVFFGFTSCGSICPTNMAELGKMYRILEEKGVKPLPNVVMISVDPERDSLEKLNHYVKAFDQHFYGARGREKSIRAMANELGIAYIKVARKGDDDSKNFDIEHTGTIMLFNPKGELTAFFTMPHRADLLAQDYILLN